MLPSYKTLSLVCCLVVLVCPYPAAEKEERDIAADWQQLGASDPPLTRLVTVVKSIQREAEQQQQLPAAGNGTDVFTSQTNIVSGDILYKYGEYAGAAYKIHGKSWIFPGNCQNSTAIQGTVVDYHWNVRTAPTFGFIAHNDASKEIVVSWRGSTVILDLISDFTAIRTEWPPQVNGSKVHTGFLTAYRSASKYIQKNMVEVASQFPDYKIVLTGHSLGAAEATLAAMDIVSNQPQLMDRMELYTYGGPRVGNSVFANWLSGQPFPIYRVVYKEDIVTHVPFRSMGYQHVSQEVWYGKDGQASFCGGGNNENSTCAGQLLPPQWGFRDHLLYPGLHFELLYTVRGNLNGIL